MSLNDTPRADRLHIAIFGKRNSGKSSLINRLTGQNLALVSDTPGTTTDPVYKSMELHPIGPVVFIDTAGFDDEGELGALRVERTKGVVDKTDVAIVVIDGSVASEDSFAQEHLWISELEDKKIPVIVVINKCDLEPVCGFGIMGAPMVKVSAETGEGIEALRAEIQAAVPEDYLRRKIIGDLVGPGGLVLLVMPQDIQAPKGRLILPQVQTIRELLDKKCTTVATTADGLEGALGALARDPDLIITDSQCFKMVYDAKPSGSLLTSFSVLFAAYKGDIDKFVAGASRLDDMTENSKVLVAEACTHVPLNEDIGRVKIPRMLRQKFGDGMKIDHVNGSDFPAGDELAGYDLVIHCGACMFNRAHVLSRIAATEAAGVPITNYGVVLAKMSGILDKITLPE